MTQGPAAGALAVAVVPGGGALVATRLPDPAARPDHDDVGDVHVVSDEGRAFPVQDTDALTALGYSLDAAVVVRPTWMALMPVGPMLARPSTEVLRQLGASSEES